MRFRAQEVVKLLFRREVQFISARRGVLDQGHWTPIFSARVRNALSYDKLWMHSLNVFIEPSSLIGFVYLYMC